MPQQKSSWQHTALKSVSAAIFYGAISVSTTFFNKAVLSVYDFQFTNFILLSQHIFTLVMLEVFKSSKMLDFPNPQLSKCKELLPVSLLYSLNVGVALSALSNLNIPMYGVLKRMTIVFVMVGESIFMKKYSSQNVKIAVSVIVAGAVVAGFGDLTFDFMAYCLASLSCFAQAAYLIVVAKTGAETGINSFGLLFYNSLLAIPFVLMFVIVFNELEGVVAYEHLWEIDFQLCFLANLFLGSMLNYSMFLCTTTNSALTTTIVGQLKNVFTIIFGFFLLGGVELHLLNALGLILNSIGGVGYSVVKYQESITKAAAAENKLQASEAPQITVEDDNKDVINLGNEIIAHRHNGSSQDSNS